MDWYAGFETEWKIKIDSEKMYDNLMNKFKFGGIDKPGIYIDENAMRMLSLIHISTGNVERRAFPE